MQLPIVAESKIGYVGNLCRKTEDTLTKYSYLCNKGMEHLTQATNLCDGYNSDDVVAHNRRDATFQLRKQNR